MDEKHFVLSLNKFVVSSQHKIPKFQTETLDWKEIFQLGSLTKSRRRSSTRRYYHWTHCRSEVAVWVAIIFHVPTWRPRVSQHLHRRQMYQSHPCQNLGEENEKISSSQSLNISRMHWECLNLYNNLVFNFSWYSSQTSDFLNIYTKFKHISVNITTCSPNLSLFCQQWPEHSGFSFSCPPPCRSPTDQ